MGLVRVGCANPALPTGRPQTIDLMGKGVIILEVQYIIYIAYIYINYIALYKHANKINDKGLGKCG